MKHIDNIYKHGRYVRIQYQSFQVMSRVKALRCAMDKQLPEWLENWINMYHYTDPFATYINPETECIDRVVKCKIHRDAMVHKRQKERR